MYRSTQICKALNIKRELLKDWILQGFITPSIPANGQGTKADYSPFDVCMIAFFQLLVKRGFKRELAKKYIDALVKAKIYKEAELKNVVFFTHITAEDVTAGTQVMKNMTGFFQDVINIDYIIKDTLQKLEK